MIKRDSPNYRWYVLGVTMLTYGIITGAVRLCMPVLFPEISRDLNLNVTQLGFIWGLDPLAGIFVGLPGGLLADRFGVRKMATVVCVLAGVFSALRGLSFNFMSMSATMFLLGLMTAAAPSIIPKATAEWFAGRQLGLANALINIAWGLGSMSATMLSATVLSPWFGSWRWVLVFFGGFSVITGLLWIGTVRDPDIREIPDTTGIKVPFKEAISRVIKIKNVWMIGVITTCLWGASMGFIGYLPLYLEDIGWSTAKADSVITVFNIMMSIGVIPMVMLSDRIGFRKPVVAISSAAMAITLIILPSASTTGVWVLVCICAFLRSGAAALFNVMIFETKGVGSAYAGTATGLANTISMIGAFVGPPLGNHFADMNSGYPFYVWGGLSALSFVLILFVKEAHLQTSPAR